MRATNPIIHRLRPPDRVVRAASRRNATAGSAR
jgi:hypothetical protein